MYPKISLNDRTILQAPFGERFGVAHEAGFTGVEFFIEEAREYAEKNGGMESVLKLLQENDLRFDQALLLGDVLSEDHAKNRKKFLDYAEAFFRDTRYLGGKTVLACATFGKSDISEAPELFAELCDLAADFELDLALEFIGWAEVIKDIRTALTIVDKASRKNGGILYDTLHHYFGGSSLQDLEALPNRYLYAVHVADANDMDLPVLDIARKHRVFPGKGVIPIAECLSILSDKGYSSSIALEIFSETYWKRPAIEVAREGFEYMTRFLSEAGFD